MGHVLIIWGDTRKFGCGGGRGDGKNKFRNLKNLGSANSRMTKHQDFKCSA